MMETTMILLISVTALAGLFLFLPFRVRFLRETVFILAAAANCGLALSLFGHDAAVSLPFVFQGFEASFRLYSFSGLIVAAAGVLSLLLALYTAGFMQGKNASGAFYGLFLLSLAMIDGAVLSDNLILLLFFWEGLLATIYGMIALAGGDAWKTAMKAFVIIGVTDLCMMAGIGLTGYLSGGFTISQIALPTNGLFSLAFGLLLVGGLGKVGAVPFHSWIPDAAGKAPLPFMAFLPAALEKLLGVYFIGRVCMDLFHMTPGSPFGSALMIIGLVTIVVTSAMALVQRDMKRMLGYATVTQVGYILLGLGTCLPAGIVGALFHTMNHALYKSGLFLTAGAVERQAGTTDLDALERTGGLAARMPLTFVTFVLTAAATLGLPPMNAFFSKELIFDAALEMGWAVYAVSMLGAFLTALAFFRLGHALFFGKGAAPAAKEAPAFMLIPMLVIAGICLFFGVLVRVPVEHLLGPVTKGWLIDTAEFSGFPHKIVLVLVSIAAALAAFLWQLLSTRGGPASGAVDPILKAPVLSSLYKLAEKRAFDPYDLTGFVVRPLAKVLWFCDRAVDFVYDRIVVVTVTAVSTVLSRAQKGSFVSSLAWAIAGGAAIIIVLAKFIQG
jgi:NADH-quinone oxidoreductase subunit L